MTDIDRDSLALGEGFYWMAEKLAWGYEEVEQDLPKAFRLFKQAADLGFSTPGSGLGSCSSRARAPTAT